MDKRIVMLRDWGCDVRGALERMLEDEEFYIECLNDIPGDRNFERLTEALNTGNISKAFDSAHTLKGVLVNLGLTPMYNQVVSIVEPLRVGKTDGLLKSNQVLLEMRDKLERILAA